MINLHDTVPLEKPISIFIEPTNRCNFKCRYCVVSLQDKYYSRIGGRRDLKIEEFYLIVNQIKSNFEKVLNCNFYMIGEPLLNVNLIDYLRIAKEESISDSTCLNTNASLLSLDIFRRLSPSLDILRISIYGFSEQDYKFHTGYPKFQLVFNNLRMIHDFISKNNIKTKIFLSIFKSHNETFDQLLSERFKEFHLFDIRFQPLTNWMGLEDDFNKKWTYGTTDFWFSEVKVCPLPFRQLVIFSDLKVSLCCNDAFKKLVVGDLKKDNLCDIWSGKKAENLRERMLSIRFRSVAVCRKCVTPYYSYAEDNLDGLTLAEYRKRKYKFAKI